jgi:hypothetical protein
MERDKGPGWIRRGLGALMKRFFGGNVMNALLLAALIPPHRHRPTEK